MFLKWTSKSCSKYIANGEIGRYLEGFDETAPLGMGVIQAIIFHSQGISPCLIEMLNIWVITGVILRADILSILAEISSCPQALLQSTLFKRVNTYSSEYKNHLGIHMNRVSEYLKNSRVRLND